LLPKGFAETLLLPWSAKGEAAVTAVFGFSFFGFFASRLPRFSPLASIHYEFFGPADEILSAA
jgi:hypothetical protein